MAAHALAALLVLAYTTLEPDEVHARWSAGEFAALVDVRSRTEWNGGHLRNATLIEDLQVSGDTSALAGCEECAIAVYCRTGTHAKVAAVMLEAAGFARVYDALGVTQWSAAGYTLVTTPEQPPSCADCAGVPPPPPPPSRPPRAPTAPTADATRKLLVEQSVVAVITLASIFIVGILTYLLCKHCVCPAFRRKRRRRNADRGIGLVSLRL